MRYFILLLTLLIETPFVFSQENLSISLQSKKQLHAPKHFYISAVVDSRKDTSNIGTIHSNVNSRVLNVIIEGGTGASVSNLIQNKVKQDTSLTGSELHITQLKLTEKQTGINGKAEVAFGVAFYINGIKTTEYTGSSYVQTNSDVTAYISQLVVNNIDRCLREFDNHLSNVKPVTEVIVDVKIDTISTNRDLISYSKNVKLQYSDFKGQEDDLSIATALTYSGINMKYSHGQQDGHIKLNVVLSCYFDKTRSWCRINHRNEEILNHELLHFQITALSTCNLAKAIKEYHFSVENYENELSTLLRNNDKESARLQSQYDKETTHGVKTLEQIKWNENIRKELNSLDCY